MKLSEKDSNTYDVGGQTIGLQNLLMLAIRLFRRDIDPYRPTLAVAATVGGLTMAALGSSVDGHRATDVVLYYSAGICLVSVIVFFLGSVLRVGMRMRTVSKAAMAESITILLTDDNIDLLADLRAYRNLQGRVLRYQLDNLLDEARQRRAKRDGGPGAGNQAQPAEARQPDGPERDWWDDMESVAHQRGTPLQWHPTQRSATRNPGERLAQAA